MPSESLAHITRAATAAEQDDFLSPIACRRRPQRRACPGTIAIRRIDARERAIAWACTACGDTGTIAGFEGGENDLSGVAREDDGPRKRRKLRVSVQEYGSWISGNLIEYGPPELRTMYAAIYAHGHITMTASDDELDSLLDALVADLNHEERPTRRRNVESIFDELDAKLPPRRRATPVASSEPIADATSAYGHGFFCATVAGPDASLLANRTVTLPKDSGCSARCCATSLWALITREAALFMSSSDGPKETKRCSQADGITIAREMAAYGPAT